MNLEEKQKFFAHRPNITTVNMGGKKLALANLPEETRRKVLNRLAEKDEVMAKGKAGILPGLKINGIQVTRDNIKDFEKKSPAEHKEEKVEPMTKEEIKVVEENRKATEDQEEEKPKYTKSELEKLSFKELKVIGKEFGTTDRSKNNLIKEILNLQ